LTLQKGDGPVTGGQTTRLELHPGKHSDLGTFPTPIAPNATAQQIIDDPAAYPGELVRSPNGTVVYAEALHTNQFQIHTSGIDFDSNYSIPLLGGKLKFALDATYIERLMVNQAPPPGRR
jgi:hypothetical protein